MYRPSCPERLLQEMEPDIMDWMSSAILQGLVHGLGNDIFLCVWVWVYIYVYIWDRGDGVLRDVGSEHDVNGME